MVKDHSDSEKGNPLPPHRLLLSINSKGSFIYIPSHRQDNTYHSLCYTSCGALAGTRNSSKGPQFSYKLHQNKHGSVNNEMLMTVINYYFSMTAF